MKKPSNPAPTLAMTPARAAESISVGIDFFQEHVLPDLPVVRRGAKTLIATTAIERWLVESAEPPMSTQLKKPGTSHSETGPEIRR